MIKLGLQITENENDLNIKIIDPTKKQLETATENEKVIAQVFKDLFDESLVNLMSEKINKNNK